MSVFLKISTITLTHGHICLSYVPIKISLKFEGERCIYLSGIVFNEMVGWKRLLIGISSKSLIIKQIKKLLLSSAYKKKLKRKTMVVSLFAHVKILMLIITIITIELTHSKTKLENSLKIKPQPADLHFDNLS